MSSNKELSKRIMEFYAKASTVNNIIKNFEKFERNDYEYIKNNWTIAVTKIRGDIDQIRLMLESCNFSLDYKQANTFHSYTLIYWFVLDRILEQLIPVEEGLNSVKMVLSNINETSKPYFAFICSRVRDLGLEDQISPSIKALYSQMTELGIDAWANKDMSSLFELAFESADEDNEGDQIDELLEDVKTVFGEDYSLGDLLSISEIFRNYLDRKNEEFSIQKNY